MDRPSCSRKSAHGVALLASFCLMGAAMGTSGELDSGKVSFPLEQISGFLDDAGHVCLCSEQAEPDVSYPAFTSDKPLYGVMRVNMEIGNAQSGTAYRFALDESGGTGAGYDRLYINVDSDAGLSDEKPLTPLQDLPAGAMLGHSRIAQQVCFDYVTFSDGSDENVPYSVETMPRLTVSEQGYATLTFVATKARAGEIEIAHRRYRVTLVNRYPLGTRWDRPETTVRLEGRYGVHVPHWVAANRLMALHEIQGTLRRRSVTAQGDLFFVEPYRGDFGTLAVGSGRRFVWTKTLGGSLFASDKAVLVGDDPEGRPLEQVSRWRVPVGDYAPEMMDVRHGPLYITISSNYHEEGAPRGKAVLARPLKVRKDKTCVLDFSKRAEVLFIVPTRNARIRPGDELVVYAVLVDPKLDIMIRNLRRKPQVFSSPYLVSMIGAIICIPVVSWRFGRKTRRRSALLAVLSVLGLVVLAGSLGALYAVDRMLHPREGYDVLNPHATIARANGEIVAEGVLPFG